MTTVLIDGDLFAYQTAAGSQKTHDFDGMAVLDADPEEGKKTLGAMIDTFAEALDASRIIVAISHTENFRKDVMPSYKSNRKDEVRPVILGELKTYLEDTYECFIRPRLEADDVLGILLTHPSIIPGVKVCVTEDKDLLSVPGLHWNPKKEGEIQAGPTRMSVEQADRRFYEQVLSGDAVDGYSGCPGVGLIGAEIIVRDRIKAVSTQRELKRGPRKGELITEWHEETAGSVWEAIVSQYEKKGLTEADALREARVARILRHTDYDFKRKEPILWTPERL